MYLSELAGPLGFGVKRPVQGLGIVEVLNIPITRRSENDIAVRIGVVVVGHKVAFLPAVNVRLCGSAAGVGVVLRGVVAIRQGPLEHQVGKPSFVEQPAQVEVSAEGVVAHLAIVIQLLIRVSLRIVAAQIAT